MAKNFTDFEKLTGSFTPATYDQATHILKNRSVISENYIDLKPINTIESVTLTLFL